MNAIEATPESASVMHRPTGLMGELYRFHGFQVLDCTGKTVGQVDWVWPSDAGDEGQYIGIRVRWLSGRAQVVPARSVRVDAPSGTLHIAYAKDQTDWAPRCSIDRPLTADQKRAVEVRFGL